MSAPVSAKELKERLKREKLVEVKGMAFAIKKIPLQLLLEDPSQLWEWARSGQDAVAEKIKGLLQSPALPAMRRVILAGVVEPRIADAATEDCVPVDMILAHHDLAAGLFIEIINLSLGG